MKLADPMAVRSKMWVCGLSLAGIAGSNSARSMYICLLIVACVTECVFEASMMRRPWPTRGCRAIQK
jgi:hypothetical protein